MNFKQTPLAILIASLSIGAYAADAEGEENPQSIKIEGKGVFAGGKMVYEEAARARATVTKFAIEEKAATSNAYQLIDKLPGVNAHSQDATGLFGGSLTIRGFTAGQLGFTVDGAPVNDSGSYDVYPQEYVDSENLEEIYVTQGTTDNDAPHIGATGGNVGLVSQKPSNKFRAKFAQTVGGLNMYKTYARVDTGALGPVKSYFSFSQSEADKWRGKGGAERFHFDAKSVAAFGAGHSVTAGFIYNKAENHFLRRARKSDWQANRYYDYTTTFPGRIINAGKADNESSLTNFYELNGNPFENYIATVKANFKLSDKVRLEIDPYFWYGYGGGSGGTTLAESSFTTGGRDLNGDGDKLDSVLVYAISKTVTNRPGVTTRLNWELNGHKLMAAFWYEQASHRQTRPHVLVDAAGRPTDPWAENVILRNDGQVYNGQSGGLDRNWKTETTVSQFTLQDAFSIGDRWSFLAGVRTPDTERKGITYGARSETQQAAFLTARGATESVSVTRNWNKVLPNVSAKFAIDDRSHAFVALSKNFRTPANFILYELIQDQTNTDAAKRNRDLAPEQSFNVDIGYRYQGDRFNFNGSVFHVDFKDRQAQRLDDDGSRRNYNVGDTTKDGFELEFGTSARNGFSVYGSASYIREKLNDDFVQFVGTTNASGTVRAAQVALPTAGKTMTDTPKWTLGAGTSYSKGRASIGLGAKYTGKRYGDLMNQESVPSMTVWDLNAAYKFANLGMIKKPTLRLAVANLFDKNYLGGIPSTQINAATLTESQLRVIDRGTQATISVGGSAPNYDIGAPRFSSIQFSAEF
ncbi:TonB-dependent receptor [Chitinimonas sp. BJYL2]|uniref:TonB-dependent receptor n=1 Tax=Chitinimonas sp. BJYL2 TaxID=2976696 RepID=UPI0022B2EA57|nr:TonB-dependent receptor [Chitinimonas sp. BJYL2]